jgi:hypothetical protein
MPHQQKQTASASRLCPALLYPPLRSSLLLSSPLLSSPDSTVSTRLPLNPASSQPRACALRPSPAKDKTHYYPMAMATHNIFPPPQTVGGAFGEERRVQYTKLAIAVGDEMTEESTEGLSKPEIKVCARDHRGSGCSCAGCACSGRGGVRRLCSWTCHTACSRYEIC